MSSRYLRPSEIRYLGRVRSNWPESAPAECRLTPAELSRYAQSLVSDSCEYPKLQVARLGGRWFALNSLQLAICRRLERDGRCGKIRVRVCPPQLLPRQLALPDGAGGRLSADSATATTGEAGAVAAYSEADAGSSCCSDGASAAAAAALAASGISDTARCSLCDEAGEAAVSEDGDDDEETGLSDSASGYCSECEREAAAAAAAAPAAAETHRMQPPAAGQEEGDDVAIDADLADLGPASAMLLQQQQQQHPRQSHQREAARPDFPERRKLL